MRAIKLVLCGVFALFTLSRVALLFMGTQKSPNAGAASNDSGQLIINLLIIIVLGAITAWLWKSSMTRQPPRR
jgi:hypothetical protein